MTAAPGVMGQPSSSGFQAAIRPGWATYPQGVGEGAGVAVGGAAVFIDGARVVITAGGNKAVGASVGTASAGEREQATRLSKSARTNRFVSKITRSTASA